MADSNKTITELIKEGQLKLKKVESMPARPKASQVEGPDLVVALRNKFKNMRKVELDDSNSDSDRDSDS